MLVVFHSKAAAEIFMYAEHAKMLLDLMGKPFEPEHAPRGVITAEQVPAALAALREAAARSAAEQKKAATTDDDAEAQRDPMSLPVGLAQRAYPLIEMLQRAEKAQAVVTWGV